MSHGERRCLGLFGLFDVDDLDAQVRVRVAVHELARRRPDLTLRLFAPFGSTRPIPVAADLPVEPIAPGGPAREAALRSELAAMVLVGRTPSGAAADRINTVYAEHPATDPRDIAACLDLLVTGIDTVPSGQDPTDPHPALLARRVWPFGVCEQRREFLRAMQWWPQRGAPVVVAGGDDDIEHVEALAGRFRLGDRDVCVVGTGIGDRTFSATLSEQLTRRVQLMPAQRSSIDDRVAAIAGASAVVSSIPAVLALADAYGRPRRPLEAFATALASRAAKRGAGTVARDEAVLEAGYDELASLAPGDVAPVLTAEEVDALRAALDTQARRVAHERVVLADYVRAVRNNAAQEIAELHAQLGQRPIDRLRDAIRHRRGGE